MIATIDEIARLMTTMTFFEKPATAACEKTRLVVMMDIDCLMRIIETCIHQGRNEVLAVIGGGAQAETPRQPAEQDPPAGSEEARREQSPWASLRLEWDWH